MTSKITFKTGFGRYLTLSVGETRSIFINGRSVSMPTVIVDGKVDGEYIHGVLRDVRVKWTPTGKILKDGREKAASEVCIRYVSAENNLIRQVRFTTGFYSWEETRHQESVFNGAAFFADYLRIGENIAAAPEQGPQPGEPVLFPLEGTQKVPAVEWFTDFVTDEVGADLPNIGHSYVPAPQNARMASIYNAINADPNWAPVGDPSGRFSSMLTQIQ